MSAAFVRPLDPCVSTLLRPATLLPFSSGTSFLGEILLVVVFVAFSVFSFKGVVDLKRVVTHVRRQRAIRTNSSLEFASFRRRPFLRAAIRYTQPYTPLHLPTWLDYLSKGAPIVASKGFTGAPHTGTCGTVNSRCSFSSPSSSFREQSARARSLVLLFVASSSSAMSP